MTRQHAPHNIGGTRAARSAKREDGAGVVDVVAPVGDTGRSTASTPPHDTGKIIEPLAVLDGSNLKLTLRRQLDATGPVRIDWFRATMPVHAVLAATGTHFADVGHAELYAPATGHHAASLSYAAEHLSGPSIDADALAAARALGHATVHILGPTFDLQASLASGRDFFQYRLPITRNGVELGWIGGGASGSKRHQDAQRQIVHINLYGEACLFISPSQWLDLKRLGVACNGLITRVDLALDFFDGLPGGIKQLEADYANGLMDNRGKRPKNEVAGDWIRGRSCTFYLGSRQAGKITRIYTKGDQISGLEANDPWVRAEIQLGHSLRVLHWDLLSTPADYFAGCSDYHASLLRTALAQRESEATITPQPLPCLPREQVGTIEAEVTRNLRWLVRTCGASAAAAFRHLSDAALAQILDRPDEIKPKRMRQFSPSALRAAYEAFANDVLIGIAA